MVVTSYWLLSESRSGRGYSTRSHTRTNVGSMSMREVSSKKRAPSVATTSCQGPGAGSVRSAHALNAREAKTAIDRLRPALSLSATLRMLKTQPLLHNVSFCCERFNKKQLWGGR